MAEKPIKTPLPADLPENWNTGQIVAPDGTTVGLTEQHGYNYLMKMVNRAQEGVNMVSEAFETVSGKRTCYVVGTSTAGWTEADCDFLCDGTDDQVEINAAIRTLSSFTGGEVLILSGVYRLTGGIVIYNFREGAILRGCGRNTILVRDRADVSNGSLLNENELIQLSGNSELRDMVIVSSVDAEEECAVQVLSQYSNEIRNVCFSVSGFEGRVKYGIVARNTYSNGVYQTTCIENCELGFMDTAILLIGNQVDRISISSCLCRPTFNTSHPYYPQVPHFIGTKNSSEVNMQMSTISIFGNQASESDIIIDARYMQGVNIFGNIVSAIEVKNSTDSDSFTVYVGNMIEGNILHGDLLDKNKPVISLGEHAQGWFVVANQIQNPAVLDGYWPIVDKGDRNIVRFNSDDASTGGGGGGTAGVTTFNGRSGKVAPASGDYTAAMTGAIPAADVKNIQPITQSAYDALAAKSPTTLYLIKE